MNEKWHLRYLELAKHISTWSKDPSTKVSAIAVNAKGQILSTGYNGFCRGVADTVERYFDRETKYKYVVHAEMNCLYNASYTGTCLADSTLYVWGLPVCSECAKGIIQTGIKTIVMPNFEITGTWAESWKLSESMLTEAGVQHKFIDINQ